MSMRCLNSTHTQCLTYWQDPLDFNVLWKKIPFPLCLGYANLWPFLSGCLGPRDSGSWTVFCPHAAYATAYLDDTVYRNNWQRHMQHLRAVLRSLSWAGLTRTQRSAWMDGWMYGIWSSTWVMGRCIPKLIRPQRLQPAQDPRKTVFGAGWLLS